MISIRLLAYFLAFLLVGGMASSIAHERLAQQCEPPPECTIRTSETMLPPPPPRRHEWRRRDRA